MKIVNFINILWDVDSDEADDHLPSRYEYLMADDFDTAEDGADFLSDTFGYCVLRFDFTEDECHTYHS